VGSAKPCTPRELVFLKHPAVLNVKERSTFRYLLLKWEHKIWKWDRSWVPYCRELSLKRSQLRSLERLLRLPLPLALELAKDYDSELSILSGLGSTVDHSQGKDSKFNVPKGDAFSAKEENELLALLRSQCSHCHGDHSPVAILPLDNLFLLANYRTAESRLVRDHLLGSQAAAMPPLASVFALQPNERDRLVLALDFYHRENQKPPLRKTATKNLRSVPRGSLVADFLTKSVRLWKGIEEFKSEFLSFLTERSQTRPMNPIHLLVPHGRSLDRHGSNTKQPREIIAFNSGEFLAPSYIGFSPKAKVLEIISWNPEEQKFDYFISRELWEGRPIRAVGVPEAICHSCHQSGAPIFSRHPWAEVPFLNSKLMDQFRDQADSHPRLWRQAQLGNPFTFDTAVRDGQKILAAAELCEQFCHGSRNCIEEFNHWGEYRQEGGLAVQSLLAQMQSGQLLARQRSSVLIDRDPYFLLDRGVSTLFYVEDQSEFNDSVQFRQSSSSSSKNQDLQGLLHSERFFNASDLNYREEFSLLPLSDFLGLGAHLLQDPLTEAGSPLFPRPFLDYGPPEKALQRLRPYFRNCRVPSRSFQ
jgi:hypothetical protein